MTYDIPELCGSIFADFGRLPDADALRLFYQLAHRFSGSAGHDLIHDGVQRIADDLAVEVGHTDGEALMWVLPTSFPRIKPVRQLNPAIWGDLAA